MIIRRWTMVVIGATFTIISAFLSNYLIAKNNQVIERFSLSAKKLERSIDEAWQNAQFLDQKQDTAFVMLSLVNSKSDGGAQELGSFVMTTLNDVGIPADKNAFASNREAFDYLVTKIRDYKKGALDSINELYYDKLQEESKAILVKNRNMTYANIALLLQLLGLIFVLSKDLLRE